MIRTFVKVRTNPLQAQSTTLGSGEHESLESMARDLDKQVNPILEMVSRSRNDIELDYIEITAVYRSRA